jgi:hypothetical protein
MNTAHQVKRLLDQWNAKQPHPIDKVSYKLESSLESSTHRWTLAVRYLSREILMHVLEALMKETTLHLTYQEGAAVFSWYESIEDTIIE